MMRHAHSATSRPPSRMGTYVSVASVEGAGFSLICKMKMGVCA